MKRLTIMMTAIALTLGMAQCRKHVETIAQPAGGTVDVTVRAESGCEKTDITATGVVTWKQGDRMYVVGETDGLLGSVSATEAGRTVTFEGAIRNLSAAQTLKFYYVGGKAFELDGSGNCTFDISGQDGSLAGIAAHSQLMYGVTTGSITPGTTDFGTVSMTSVMAIAHLNINDGGAAVSGPVAVTGGFATSTFNAKTYAGGTLTGTAGDMTMTFATGTTSTGCHIALLPGSQTLTFTTSDGKTKTLAAKTLAANTFYNAGSAIEVVLAPSYLPGEFTVSSGVKVKFAPGNLYYNGADDSHKMNSALPSGWNFYGHQWDCYPSGTSSATKSMEISLFTWGYGSWSTNYSTTSYQEGLDVTMTDWGGITDLPDNAGGKTWRTLSKDEWAYLLNTRTASTIGSTSNARYAEVKVNGVCGMMLFPDTFTWPSDVTTKPTTFNKYSSTWNGVDYDTADFGKLESFGVVFLPTAGSRNGTLVFTVGSYGVYWSSTPGVSNEAYTMEFRSGGVYTDNGFRRSGESVRLVRSAS